MTEGAGTYICDLQVSSLILFKEQSKPGRCIVAYKDHVSEIVDISREESNAAHSLSSSAVRLHCPASDQAAAAAVHMYSSAAISALPPLRSMPLSVLLPSPSNPRAAIFFYRFSLILRIISSYSASVRYTFPGFI